MSSVKPGFVEYFQELKQLADTIPDELGMEIPRAKDFVLAYLALEYDLKVCVEIAVQTGTSFLAGAYSSRLLNGMVYRIDPRHAGIAGEQTEAIEHLRSARIPIDMLHVNASQDAFNVEQTVELYLPLVRDGGFLVLDGMGRDTASPVFDRLKKKYAMVLENGHFAILQLRTPGGDMPTRLTHRLGNLHSLIENIGPGNTPARGPVPDEPDLTTVSVVVISYNQEDYIGECLEGILAQQGDLRIELVIGDDCSTDRTPAIIKHYTDSFCSDRVRAKILSSDKNIGMTRNLQRCLNACTGEYIAICEGDDYWFDRNKLHKQVDFLKSHPGYALCFHHVYLYFQDREEFSTLEAHRTLQADRLTTRDLVAKYSIGNMSCCMYDARHMQKLPEGLFDLYIGDWMFNVYYSRFGDIGRLKEFMSVYRKHNQGVWSGSSQTDQFVQLHAHIGEYNRFLNYEYDAEFSQKQRNIESAYPERFDKKIRSNRTFLGLIKHLSPDFVIRIYRKLTRRP